MNIATDNITLQIPFEGFYCSIIDSFIDCEIENEIERREEDGRSEFKDTKINFAKIASDYVVCFNEYFKDIYDIDLDLKIKDLFMPREYNFETDTITCTITPKNLYKLKRLAFEENHINQERVDNKFKSRDGFMSFYGEFCHEWDIKKLSQWDENELSVLFPIIDDYMDVYDGMKTNFQEDVCNSVEFIEQDTHILS